jgi:hypothetical protein
MNYAVEMGLNIGFGNQTLIGGYIYRETAR